MTEQTTHTLEVTGAVLTYDVRRNGAGEAPVLLLIGSPKRRRIRHAGRVLRRPDGGDLRPARCRAQPTH